MNIQKIGNLIIYTFLILSLQNNLYSVEPEEILENGKNGFLFQNNNLQDFLNKFEEFKKTDNKQITNKKKNV